jgi:small-conductance mechanosensitive channel
VKNQEPLVRFTDFAATAMNFSVFFWLPDTSLVDSVKSDIRFAICEAFREKGISMPCPQQKIKLLN